METPKTSDQIGTVIVNEKGEFLLRTNNTGKFQWMKINEKFIAKYYPIWLKNIKSITK